MSDLRYEVLVHDGVRRQRVQTLPDSSPIVSSPLASTLIFGDSDAVLVDPPFTREQVQRTGDWIERSGKNLAFIYATHGHGGSLVRHRPSGATLSRCHRIRHRGHDRGDARAGHRGPCPNVGRRLSWPHPPSPVVYQPVPRTVSSSRASAWSLLRSATPTQITPQSCMCRRSVSW